MGGENCLVPGECVSDAETELRQCLFSVSECTPDECSCSLGIHLNQCLGTKRFSVFDVISFPN